MTALGEAVRSGDLEAVRALLGEGADPNAPGRDGLPPLCAALAAYAYEAAGVLVAAGADPDRVLADGTTPLLRAVEGGSPAMVGALLWSQDLPAPGQRLAEAERVRLLEAARHWYGAGAEAELRRRTGAVGPARISSVEEQWCEVEEVVLGGSTVRGGHGAVLTTLERVFGVPVPPEELVARALRHPDPSHVDWAASRIGLEGAREVVTALRHHPAADHRLFAADWLWTRQLGVGADAYPHHEEDRELLAAWAVLEPDSVVLAQVLAALTEHDVAHPGLEGIGLEHVGHRDPRVRQKAVDCLYGYDRPITASGREALRALTQDPDGEVRFAAAAVLLGHGDGDVDGLRAVVRDLARDPRSPVRDGAADFLAESDDRTADATELLLSLLDADAWLTRSIGAYGLALRDHPGTPQAYARVEELGPPHPFDHRARALGQWRERNDPGRGGTPSPGGAE
ncbi:HEAT repeat domain-containing protein [Streptomyces sp. NBC_00503]|uniref:HEAT repeat domain-containing protein n=1 Tax=Streptomyces sp. NBC_00503 TaxID=2903659 RepID=UPI002E8141E1|nr:HEAT repeat domain-containing protein [Streptomyces sp. NBC_00503]WUD82904.1 HEAT repeat domain-containing protein [Streptomyces sp. NBC_00503]